MASYTLPATSIMPSYTLPATSYSQPRQARWPKLNTIIEDDRDEHEGAGEGRGRRGERTIPSPIPSSASTISSYYQSIRYPNDFDGYYDAPDDEWEREGTHSADSSQRSSWTTTGTCSRHPSLIIPSPRHWPTVHSLHKDPSLSSPGLPISPLTLSLLAPAAPASNATSSATPSLDGSLSSDQIAVISAPPTPDIACSPADMVDWNNVKVATSLSDFGGDASSLDAPKVDFRLSEDTGVRLPVDALDILRHLSIDIPDTSDSGSDAGAKEMEEVPLKLAPGSRHVGSRPASASSEYSISQLSIPSPGGFFSSLDANARHTWNLGPGSGSALPSTATAENFYNLPWSGSEEVMVGQAVDDQTARSPAGSDLVVDEIGAYGTGKDYDEEYEQTLKHKAEMSVDRTSSWLSAQTTYLSALRETGPSETAARRPSLHQRKDSLPTPVKKVVQFLDTELANKEGRSPSKADPLYYQAFQHMSNVTSPTDSFIHRQARYDALQASRSGMQQSHVDKLLGNYHLSDVDRPAPPRPISLMPFPGAEEETAEQRVFARVAREQQALEQVAPSMWVVEALRYLSGGRLLNSPAALVLQHAPPLELGPLPEHVRVLDLGGQASCGWAWHCARDYPNVKTYTATSDPCTAAMGIRGPRNHRLVSVEHLWRLPFPDNHFDAISARGLFAHLKLQKTGPGAAGQDQIDACLAEALRVLKPGGYLEFFVLDAEIMHGGPRGTAASVELGFNLRARGYDPAPTKSWLGRVRRAGLVDIKRAWMFLPMGALREGESPTPPPSETSAPRAGGLSDDDGDDNEEAVRGPVGRGRDAAEVSGLLGSWLWEAWVRRLEAEMEVGAGTPACCNVAEVVEEGRGTGAGWRCMRGWARKAT